MTSQLEEARRQILTVVREFVEKEVVPVASKHDEDDTYPADLVGMMAEMEQQLEEVRRIEPNGPELVEHIKELAEKFDKNGIIKILEAIGHAP